MKNFFFGALFCAIVTAGTGVYGQQVQLLETDPLEKAPAAVNKSAAPQPAVPDTKNAKPQAGSPGKKTPAAAAKAPDKPSGKTKTPARAAAAVSVSTGAAVKPAASAPSGKGGFSVEKRHRVTGGDTLWGLSGKYYSDPYKWGKIYNANLSTVKDPDRIYPEEELIIPDIMEDVVPARKAPAAISGADTVREGELSVDEVKRAAAPASSPSPAAAARQASGAAGKISEDLGAYERGDLSEEMPQDQKEWSASIKVVPDNWAEDGFVTGKEKTGPDGVADGLSVSGETVVIRLSGAAPVKKGDYLTVYLRGAAAFDKQGKRIGRELQPVGIVEVLSVDGRQVKARVVEASSTIRKGLVVKLDIRS